MAGARRLTRPACRSASTWSQSSKHNIPLDIHPEVQQALAENKPIVAFETALVTHGFPYPNNLQLALSLEDIVRSTGATPATIGIIGGRVKIGLKEGELERLSSRQGNPSKISRRDISPAIVMKADGGGNQCNIV